MALLILILISLAAANLAIAPMSLLHYYYYCFQDMLQEVPSENAFEAQRFGHSNFLHKVSTVQLC